MSRSAGTIGGLVDGGAFDGDNETDWLVLKLVAHAVAAGVLGLGLLVAMLHGFVRGYVLGGSVSSRSD